MNADQLIGRIFGSSLSSDTDWHYQIGSSDLLSRVIQIGTTRLDLRIFSLE